VDHGKVKDLQIEDHKLSQMRSWQVEKMVQLGLPGWENYVPEAVVDIIKERKLYQKETVSH
jgi:intergrase/recombinase